MGIYAHLASFVEWNIEYKNRIYQIKISNLRENNEIIDSK